MKCSCGYEGKGKIVKTAALENETDPEFDNYLYIAKKIMIPFIARICPKCGLLNLSGNSREKRLNRTEAICPSLVSKAGAADCTGFTAEYQCGVSKKLIVSDTICISEDWPKCRDAYANKMKRRNWKQ